MNTTRAGLCQVVILAALLPSAGCSALQRFERSLEAAGVARFSVRLPDAGRTVATTQDPSRLDGCGNAAVIDARHVLTVAHVLNPDGTVWVSTCRGGGWVQARETRRFQAWPEPLVLLELDAADGLAGLFQFSGFGKDDAYVCGRGQASYLRSARRTYRLEAASVQPGDSGAAILDPAGQLLGLLYGRYGGAPVWISVPRDLAPPSPAPAHLNG